MSVLRALRRAFARPETIDTLEKLESHVSTRSAFIAQKTLYGYLKTRMGTRYPTMFQDDMFVASIDIAKMRVFASCLADFSIYAAAHALEREKAGRELRARTAAHCHARGLSDNPAPSVEEFSPEEEIGRFELRVSSVDWGGIAKTREIFTPSSQALVKWAPIADELKALDSEYVANSMRFAWLNVRKRFIEQLDKDATGADARRRLG